jgi:ABC-type amino acid transport substrate-binding protein
MQAGASRRPTSRRDRDRVGAGLAPAAADVAGRVAQARAGYVVGRAALAAARIQRRIDLLEKYLAEHRDLIGADAFTGSTDVVARIFQFLAAGRADTIIMTSDVYDWSVRSGDTPRGVASAGCLANEKMAVGLSRARPERARLIAARLDSGIRKLRQSGRLKLILDDYGIALWGALRH